MSIENVAAAVAGLVAFMRERSFQSVQINVAGGAWIDHFQAVKVPGDLSPIVEFLKDNGGLSVSINFFSHHVAVLISPTIGGPISVNVDDGQVDRLGWSAILCDLGALCVQSRPEVPAGRGRRFAVGWDLKKDRDQ